MTGAAPAPSAWTCFQSKLTDKYSILAAANLLLETLHEMLQQVRPIRHAVSALPNAASKSSAETLRQVQKHVDKGNVEAQMHLANVYHHGTLGLKKSPKRAFQMCELAAAQGDVKAQFALGSVCYDSGEGAKINYKTAARWLRSAAEQGHPGAQLYLGAALYIGKGVAQSHDEAVQWFRLAAAQGDADGLYSLGMCYATGEGVPQDPRGGTTPLQARRGAGARRRSGGGRAQI
eukprot:CAMPEP_0206814650 /NCGR_PEP_ID=MMETSP0975-20121206/8888_1 /ASSEMBLY_ACC=CAM_ASM_000399 /TAXON_ID=483370 /ORGANISM="non described non described, Strain CCMP2097" /LENGTH=232 /DNA_ID=CAMNT_0054356821 /DNA_START=87 /DNA_END=783 /DNA_ORIENTATION=-